MVEAEEQACGFTHKQVSQELAKRWVLAPFIQDAIANHDHPDQSTVDKEVCCAVAIANTLSYEHGFPPIPGVVSSQKSDDFLSMIEITPEQVSQIVERVIAELNGDEVMTQSAKAA
jgi:HD-like signal output (HDOD) protein